MPEAGRKGVRVRRRKPAKGSECRAIHRQRLGSGKAGRAEKHIHAGFRQPAYRIGAADAGANAAHALHHG